MNKKRSILIYCGDVLGLGHQRRNTAIASRLVEELPNTSVILLTSLPGGFLQCPDRIDLVKLPSLRKTKGGSVGARTLGLKKDEVKRLRRSIIEGIAHELRPDLVLVDHKPTGVWNELLPSLERWRADPAGPTTVLGVRDILDDPARTIEQWTSAGVYEAIDLYYDRVMIYGSDEVFPTREKYGLGKKIQADYCGYVCAPNGFRGKDVARAELGLTAKKIAVVTAGGGSDGFPMMKASLDALRHLNGTHDLELVCVAGPFMDPDQLEELRRLSSDLRARVLWCADQLPAYFEAADVVVTMAGYNSLLEAVRQGRPTLVMPRSGPSAEQGIRAHELGARGIVRAVSEREWTPEKLSALIVDHIDNPGRVRELPGMDGLDKTVATLQELLGKRDRRIVRHRKALRAAAGEA